MQLVGYESVVDDVENGIEVPQIIKNRIFMMEQSHFWVYSQNNWKQTLKGSCTPKFIAALLIIAEN